MLWYDTYIKLAPEVKLHALYNDGILVSTFSFYVKLRSKLRTER